MINYVQYEGKIFKSRTLCASLLRLLWTYRYLMYIIIPFMIQEVFYNLNILLNMITHLHQILVIIAQQLDLLAVLRSYYLLEVYIFKIKMILQYIFHILLG